MTVSTATTLDILLWRIIVIWLIHLILLIIVIILFQVIIIPQENLNIYNTKISYVFNLLPACAAGDIPISFSSMKSCCL